MSWSLPIKTEEFLEEPGNFWMFLWIAQEINGRDPGGMKLEGQEESLQEVHRGKALSFIL